MTRFVACLCALTFALPHARAEPLDRQQAKEFFKAGAVAYEMGDYAAAIQALDAAYLVTPLPAIAFSLAQAERRQYFVSHERLHLERAITLFRTYLSQVTSGGRRADATDALGQLEPLAQAGVARADTSGAEAAAQAVTDKTRLMISCETPGARIVFDNGEPQPSPAIAQLAPGAHRVRVSAPGFFPVERIVEAVAGEFLPVEVPLRPQPAQVLVHAKPQAALHIDGALIGEIEQPKRLEIAGGPHIFVFAKNGHHLTTIETNLAPGSERDIGAELGQTPQRSVATALFVTGGLGVAAGGVLAALAFRSQDQAREVLARKQSGNISASELESYNTALEQRARFRIFAAGSVGFSAAALVVGVWLYVFDQPDARAPFERRSQLLLPEVQVGSSGGTLGLRQRF